jgi:hypothetical protein
MPKRTRLPSHLPAGSKYVIESPRRNERFNMDASSLGIARWPSRGPASSAGSNRRDGDEQGDTSPLCTSQHCSSAKSAQCPAMSSPCFHS